MFYGKSIANSIGGKMKYVPYKEILHLYNQKISPAWGFRHIKLWVM